LWKSRFYLCHQLGNWTGVHASGPEHNKSGVCGAVDHVRTLPRTYTQDPL